ncbi:hypothetical protein M407DRAFT_62664, partial [Tulasnella calospora MUT 4182]
WNGLTLDPYFDDSVDSWASMRTSWTDINGRAGHGNPDGGEFVTHHAGARW